MLQYLESVKTGAPVDDMQVIIKTNYYYETTTGVVYFQAVYDGNFLHTDPLTPMVNPDGSFTTLKMWQLAKIQEERSKEIHSMLENLQDIH